MRQLRTSLVLLMVVLALGVGLAACKPMVKAGEQIEDSAITSAVKTRLAGDPDVSAHDIDVDTEEGVVTLNGTVESQFQKDEAGRIARDTEGVRSVINNLKVGM